MKFYTYILFSIIILISCKKNEEIPVYSNLYLKEKMYEAESLRFTLPQKADSIITLLVKYLEADGTDYDWAQYYFVKSHIALTKDRFIEAFELLDSAVYSSPIFEKDYSDKVNLAFLLIYQSSFMYEAALECHKKLDLSSTQLNDNEKLITALSAAKISRSLMLKSEQKANMHLADSLAKRCHDSIDLGLYYHHKSLYQKDFQNKISFKKQALEYWKKCEYPLKVYLTYCSIADSYAEVNPDSSLTYLNYANTIKQDKVSETFIKGTRYDIFCDNVLAQILYQKEEYEKSNKVVNKLLKKISPLKMESSLYFLYQLKADNHFALKEYDDFKTSMQKSLKHRLKYSSQISSQQIHINNAKEHVEELKKKEKLLRTEYKVELLKRQLLLVYSISISLLLLLLFYNWSRIVVLLKSAYLKIHKKDLSILHLQNKIEKIDYQIVSSSYKDSTKLKNIHNTIIEDSDITNWEVFNEMYKQRYPNGESCIRKCFPDLTMKDYQHLMCLHWGLSCEKIGSIFRIQPDSVRKRSRRIKLNSNISKSQDLLSVLYKRLNSLK